MNESIAQTRPSRRIGLLTVAGLTVLLVACVPASAFAQAPHDDPVKASGLQENVVGGLPFTGLDAIALFAVALALLSIGFALRRTTGFSLRRAD